MAIGLKLDVRLEPKSRWDKIRVFYSRTGKGRLSDVQQVVLNDAKEVLVLAMKRAYGRDAPKYLKGVPLHPFTMSRKSGRKDRQLHDKGTMRAGVTAIQVKEREWQVGFSNDRLAGLALIHEFGARIKVTDKMRGFLATRGFHLKETTKHLVIPARPRWQLVLEKSREAMFAAVVNGAQEDLDFKQK
jgi:hypothetical protein